MISFAWSTEFPFHEFPTCFRKNNRIVGTWRLPCRRGNFKVHQAFHLLRYSCGTSGTLSRDDVPFTVGDRVATLFVIGPRGEHLAIMLGGHIGSG